MARRMKNASLSYWLFALGEKLQFRPETAFAPITPEEEQKKKTQKPFLMYRRKIKNALSRMAEQSFFLGKLHDFSQWIFSTGTRSLGALFFTCGFLQILFYFASPYLPFLKKGEDNLLFGVCLVFLTLFCSFSRGDIKDAYKKSFLYHGILKPFFGIKPVTIPLGRRRDRFFLMVLGGAFLAALSLFFGPMVILAALLLLGFSSLVFIRPEVGLISAASAFLFLPLPWLFALVMLTLVSFFAKCAIGRRNLYFSPLNVVMLLALLPILFSRQEQKLMLFLTLFFLYYLSSCLLRASKWIRRILFSMSAWAMFSAMLLCLRFSLLQWAPRVFWVLPELDSLLFVLPETELGILYVMLCPVACSLMHSCERFGNRLMSFFALVSMLISLFILQSSQLWIAALISLLLYLICTYRSAIYSLIALLLCGGIAFALLPQKILSDIFLIFGWDMTVPKLEAPASFFSVLKEEYGVVFLLMLCALLLYFGYECVRFARRCTMPELFPRILGGISAVSAWVVAACQGVSLDWRSLVLLVIILAFPAAAHTCALREEIRLPY